MTGGTLADAYRLAELPGAVPGVGAPAGYALEVRYLKARADAVANSDTYYAYGALVRRRVDFAPTAPDTDNPLRWQSLGIAKLSLADVDGDGRAGALLALIAR